MEYSKKIQAIGLSSGGLDSILAALVLKNQGIDVLWVSFETPFFSSDKARQASRMTGIDLRVEKITNVYMEMLCAPKAGYGKNMNPCMDCHALMFRLAGQIMEQVGASFLFSGEVLGQRPKSQTKNALNYVAKHSGYAGYILRPLSAKILEPTIVENLGLVDREKLFDFSGRTRKPQIALAKALGVTKYPAPGGGCLLTDKEFANRLKDLLAHQNICAERDFELLKHGRHFRIHESAKAIVGRNKADNDKIMALADPTTDIEISMARIVGPMVLMPNYGGPEPVTQAANLCAAYSKAGRGETAEVAITHGQSTQIIQVTVADKGEFTNIRL